MKNPKILIIGDSCIDQYIMGTVNRICPEAPVLILNQTEIIATEGMAANVKLNIVALDGDAILITNAVKPYKKRFIDSGTNQMLLRVDENDSVLPISRDEMDYIKRTILNYDAVIISDYCKGYLDTNDIADICSWHPKVFVDTKKTIGSWISDAFILKINSHEYTANRNFIDDELEHTEVIVTLGGDGCKYQDATYPTANVAVRDVSGAGDTFIAALVVEYLRLGSMDAAIQYANHCASIVVQKFGVQTI